MAEISLRAYVKEIDNLVETEQLDEAMAHCRHILELHPKHVETYRILGKAYLEAKRYGDAADIFQRVLSSIPDDFVAHIGMAIVREDEGNLDASIWHIERAFETNPANPAIQQELRRLIGRRDGLEPSKVHMTRGALARMYAHGELYPQAIAELISALHDDSDRTDLLVLLATMYWRTKQFPEAAEICNQILNKLPYCRDANRIMAAILQMNDKSDEATSYHRRLASLDPYAAYITKADIDPQTVDANTVHLERLVWQPGQVMPAAERVRPEWATSISAEKQEVSQELEPSWMDELKTPAAPVTPSTPTDERGAQSNVSGEPSEDHQIPEFMKEAGWQKATGEAVEGRVSFSDAELSALDKGNPPEPSDEGELTPADIPKWLKDKAPSEVSAEEIEITEPEEEIPIEPAQGARTSDAAAEADEPTPGEEAQRLPSWLDRETPGATTTIVTWLEEKSSDEDEFPPQDQVAQAEDNHDLQPVEEAAEEKEETIPEWLKQPVDIESEDTPREEVKPAEEGPSWLEGVAEAAAQQDAPPTEEITPPGEPTPDTSIEETPDWMQSSSISEIQQEPSLTEETPSWLEGIAEPEATTSTEPPANTEEERGWLSGIAEPEAEIAPEEMVHRPEAPEWLKGIAEITSDETLKDLETPIEEIPDEPVDSIFPEATAIETPTPQEETPDWLMDFAAAVDEEPIQTLEMPEIDAAELSDVLEPQVDELGQIDKRVEEVAPEVVTQTTEQPADIVSEDKLDDEEIMGWLEELAAKQDIVAEEAAIPTEEPTTAPPAPPEIHAEAPADEEQVVPEESEESMEWLERLAAERGIDAEVSLPPEEIPKKLEETVEIPEKYEEIEVAAWLDRMSTQPVPKVKPEVMGTGATAWLEELDTGEPVPYPVEPTTLEPKDEIVQSAVEPVSVEPAVEEKASTPSPPEIPQPLPQIEPEAIEPPLEVEASVPATPETSPVIVTPVAPESPAESTPTIPEIPPVEAAPAVPEALVEEPTPATSEALLEPTPAAPETVVEPTPAVPETPAEPPPTAPETLEEPVPDTPETMVEPPAVPEMPAEPLPTTPETVVEPVPAAPETPVEAIPTAPDTPVEPPSLPKKPGVDASQLLEDARQALSSFDFERAAVDYGSMIKNNLELDTVIKDLKTALEHDPNVPALWQALGDAYMKDNQLSEAIEAYQHGMDVA
jgi:tetratricopeptide (TPR) repeat protein